MPEKISHKPFPAYHPTPDEEYMSEKQVAHFRNVLDVLKQDLVSSPQPENKISGQPYPGESTSVPHERRQLEKIAFALSRMEAGEYGYCDNCGIEIGLKRLETRPATIWCLECKAITEAGANQAAQNRQMP